MHHAGLIPEKIIWCAMLERSEFFPAPDLAERYARTRDESVALTATLSDEDCAVQSMADTSPVKWHLAHTTWFFETFILEKFEPDFTPFQAAFRVLFNSYYNGVGEKFHRPQRGLLTRPSRPEVLAYRRNVDLRMETLLRHPVSAELSVLVELGLQHEQQHQELIVTDVLDLLSANPLFPVYRNDAPDLSTAEPLAWHPFDGGIVEIGHDGADFSFDNETPRHRCFLEPYELASRLVTNAEFLSFIEHGGYSEPSFWLSEGWDLVQAQNIKRPTYWHCIDGSWHSFSSKGLKPLQPNAPVLNISYFEANAYANWAEARLPTEFEWEHAAVTDHNLEQMFGTAWQWTSSSYAPYPGFVPAPGAIGEYNGKFMVNQYVLRGSSLATPPGHARATYRNFFPATARWQFSGLRLAR